MWWDIGEAPLDILGILCHRQVLSVASAVHVTSPGWNLRKESAELPVPKSLSSRLAAQSVGESLVIQL